jgi:hypothetical protein
MITLTTDGNRPINGISQGREFCIALSGTFNGATVKAQYATAGPAKANITLDDNEDDDAIVLTAIDGGTAGNGITVAVTVPDAPNAILSHTQTNRAFVILTATDSGDSATVDIGEGANGTVTVTRDAAGIEGNTWDIQVIAPTAEDADLAASITFANARPRIIVSLGTDSEGDPDDAKNTATLIAAAIDDLAGFSAAASGTGDDAVAAQSVTAFEGGGDNATNISTVAEVLAYLQREDAFKRHFSAALANDADDEELIKPLTATALAGGTNGTFVDFIAPNAISFTAAGQIIGTNCGVLPTINLNVASAGGSTSVLAIVTELPR